MNGALSIDGGTTPYFYGWYDVYNVTANTFDVSVTATGAWTSGTVDVFGFQISSFTPNMASSLNSKSLLSVDYYYAGFLPEAEFLLRGGRTVMKYCGQTNMSESTNCQ